MPQLHVDSDHLHAYASELKGFSADVEQTMGQINSSLQQLGQTWRDEGYQEFARELTRTAQMVRALTEEIERVVPLLQQDATDIDALSAQHPTS